MRSNKSDTNSRVSSNVLYLLEIAKSVLLPFVLPNRVLCKSAPDLEPKISSRDFATFPHQ
ncbi:hypothetical protein D3C84_358500 [compost metagenome]